MAPQAITLRMIQTMATTEQWDPERLVREIQSQLAVTALRAQRLARGWTLVAAVKELRRVYRLQFGSDPPLTHQRLSQWEKNVNRPSSAYLDVLCRLYTTRPDLLGFGKDHTLDGNASSVALSRPSSLQIQRAPRAGTEDHEGDNVDRRQLMQSIAMYGGVAISGGLLESLNASRTRADSFLERQSVSPATVDHWEQIAADYGRLQLAMPLEAFIAQAKADFDTIIAMLDRPQNLEAQRRLYRVTAQLAGLIACDINSLGDLTETRGWFHTARLAADESGDRQVRAWVRGYEAVSYLWYGRPAERAVDLARTAQIIAGQAANVAGALGAAIEGRAQATLGNGQEARAAVHRSESIYERLPESDTKGTRLGFYEGLLRFCQANTLTILGESREAMTVQERALELPDTDYLDATLIRLDQAMCLLRTGETEEACRVAGRSLIDLPAGSRHGVAFFRTRQIAQLASAGNERLAAVNELRETLESVQRI